MDGWMKRRDLAVRSIKQGRIHNSISRAQVGRGNDESEITFRLELTLRDGLMDQWTDLQSNL